jgi:hemerythrin-like domain-containing protein
MIVFTNNTKKKNIWEVFLSLNDSIKILPYMVKDHCKIEDLLDELEEKSKNEDFDELIDVFYEFEWTLEKHVFTEEKAVFTCYNPSDVSEGYKMLPKLTEHHNFILNKLNIWRDNIRKRKPLNDVYSLKEYLKNHREFEEEEFYPRLDKELSEKEKNRIISKISEIV